MTEVRPVPFSVLDLAPIPEGADAAEALRRSGELARAVEDWGYRRYWVAEHHNMPGIASSAPAVIISHLAAVTRALRIGSGGVMLPNHAPLVVAEQFGTLEALYPGRIDLGIGRAPGTDPVTAAALRRPADPARDDSMEQLGQLLGFFSGAFPDGHPYRRIHAVPGEGDSPSVWLLGSSGWSAQAAGHLGLPFAFAHHFMPANTLGALELYRSSFRPSRVLERPYVMLGVAVVAADDERRAKWLHGPSRLSMLRLRTGRPGRLPTPEEAAERTYTPAEQALIQSVVGSHVVGDPETVEAQLRTLVAETGADELMVTTNVHGHADRLHSYEILRGLSLFQPTEDLAYAGGGLPVL
jgi:luciferase family oxidoreductase group 1